MMKYKVGDKVRIRKDLKIGEQYDGFCYVIQKMHDLGGKIACITEVIECPGVYRINLGDRCYWTAKMFEDVGMEVQGMNKCVVIDVDGNKVVARCGDKKGIARCHPDDDFDFYVGAKLALERLEETEKPYAWLKEGMEYYLPDVTSNDLYEIYSYNADGWDRMYIERGIVFQKKEEVIECAKKLLAVVKREG